MSTISLSITHHSPENFQAMAETLSKFEMDDLRSKVVLTLRGDKAENKLLGIQFGSKK
ncbi:hypothetical protein R1917_00520 [Citrobacter koseri]|uniref:hypothetical protein n=1 Tax=Citrobacter koseri TaxID=545 RepID=UPI0029429206|nr:hypothetical protein [Citrobacter koseri]WOJ33172.1 hypothetical protein R1917_00520 [Citrobacter koseri]WOJ37817.1 hypothetical protein R1243_21580 [Citrobacter koseri]